MKFQKGLLMADKEQQRMADTEQKSTPPPSVSMIGRGIYYFHQHFSNETTAPLIQYIIERNLEPAEMRPEQITIIVNSPGGAVHSLFALVDVIRGSAIPISTLGLGMTASCGTMLLMAGHKGRRFITPNTSILSHQYTGGSYGKEHELFADIVHKEQVSATIMAHYMRCTRLPEKKIREVLLPPHDVWLSSKEAVKYGIVDKIKEFKQ